MMWNELDFESQMKILSLIGKLLSKQKDPETRDGLAAAISELEAWSNSPCEVIEEPRFDEEMYVAQAVPRYGEDE